MLFLKKKDRDNVENYRTYMKGVSTVKFMNT